MEYRIGTRGSKLALVQAESVRKLLAEAYPQHTFTIRVVRTAGDREQNMPLSGMGGKGVFVREIEELLLGGEIHIGVHSMKDMPALPADGLIFAPCIGREDPRDALVLREAACLRELRDGACIATGSVRRAFQLLRLRPDIKIREIRGNIDTRLQKMEDEKLDGIVLAAAGLHRLGMRGKITEYLSCEQMVPAPAQGALALEIREDNALVHKMLKRFRDTECDKTVEAERRVLRLCGGDCHMPLGALCEKVPDGYRLRAVCGNDTGGNLSYADVKGRSTDGLAEAAVRMLGSGNTEGFAGTEAHSPESGNAEGFAGDGCLKVQTGTVYLVGAGPGCLGLLTVRGMELLRKAGCVVYDRLISEEMLSLPPAGCERVYVGKENRNHAVEQEDIEKLLVQKAREYQVVVRLKGGDPYVFGRGGEEALALLEAGIRCEVVPGVTSAVAGPACAGVPVTHRGLSGGFRVVTARDRRGGLADIDFDSMAKGRETCVFLMGLSVLGEIVEKLIGAGMNPDTPAAVISNAAMEGQEVCAGRLSEIAGKTERAPLASPAVIVVGETAGLAGRLPVMGAAEPPGRISGGEKKKMRVLVTKIGKKESPVSKMLRQKGIEADEYMAGEIEYIRNSYGEEELKKPDWLVFTSRHGVRGFFRSVLAGGCDVRVFAGKKIAVIGEKTGKALADYGLRPDFVARKADGGSLFAELEGKMAEGESGWYIRGEESSAEIPSRKRRADWTEQTVYRNREPDGGISADRLGEYGTAVFTCASSARRLAGKTGGRIPEEWNRNGVYGIGPTCAKELARLGFEKVILPDKADYQSLVEKIAENMDGSGSGE